MPQFLLSAKAGMAHRISDRYFIGTVRILQLCLPPQCLKQPHHHPHMLTSAVGPTEANRFKSRARKTPGRHDLFLY
jgi:hypothetical protein